MYPERSIVGGGVRLNTVEYARHPHHSVLRDHPWYSGGGRFRSQVSISFVAYSETTRGS